MQPENASAGEDAPGGFRRPDAFWRLGLTSNPFNHLDPDQLARRVPPHPWIAALVERLLAGPERVLVLHGPSGVGKSSSARMIERALVRAEQGPSEFVRLADEGVALPTRVADATRLLVIDSSQRASRWRRGAKVRRLVEAMHGRRLILSGQVDITAGVRLPVAVLRVEPPAPDVDEVVAVHDHFVRAARLGRAESPVLSRDEAAAILREAGPNRYRVHRGLYLRYERLASG